MKPTLPPFLSLSLVLLCLTVASPGFGKPNIVLILADDLGYADLGVHGSTEAVTPHLDSIAARGIRCTQAYISAPVCSPSRAGILTGRYQNRFGFEFLVNDESTAADGELIGLDPAEATLAERMQDLGYTTACIGKWHLGTDDACLPTNRGFDVFYGTLGQSSYFTPTLIDSRRSTRGKKVSTPGYYVTDDYSRRAVEFIEEHAGTPFFLYLPHFAVHKPHDATERYLSRFPAIDDPVRRAYLAMLAAMDDGIGELLAVLRDTGIEENTLVLFLSDNGGTQGSSNDPLRGKKGGLWEGGIRTPLLVQWPARLPEGTVFHEPVLALDLFPTCIAAAGGAIDESWRLDGVDLLPYFAGKTDATPHETIYWKFGTQWAIRHRDWKLVQAREGRGGSIQIARPGPVRLFDLAEDPREEHDLAAGNPGHAARLRELWEAWDKTLPAPAWRPNPIE